MRKIICRNTLEIDAECAIAEGLGEVVCNFVMLLDNVMEVHFGQPNERRKKIMKLEGAFAQHVIDEGEKAGIILIDGKIKRTK